MNFYHVRQASLEALLLAVGVFLLTMLIKWPIKHYTKSLEETKRKAINSIIIIIPLILAELCGILLYGLLDKQWFCQPALKTGFGIWLLSVSIYAVWSRLWLVIKGIFSGEVKLDDALGSEALQFFEQTAKLLDLELKKDEKSLTNLQTALNALFKTKEILEKEGENLDISKLSLTNTQIKSLQSHQQILLQQIANKKNLLVDYTQKLKQKGENNE